MEEGVRQKFETEKREKIMIWNYRGEKVIMRTEKGTSSKNSTLDVESAEKARREEGGVSGNILYVMRLIRQEKKTEEEASY